MGGEKEMFQVIKVETTLPEQSITPPPKKKKKTYSECLLRKLQVYN